MITDIISLILILCGSFFVFTAALGLVRFPDTMSRIHAITKPQTLGLVLSVTGALIRVVGSEEFSITERGDLGILLLLIVFSFITSPVTAQRMGRVARREGLYGPNQHLTRNDAPAQRQLRQR